MSENLAQSTRGLGWLITDIGRLMRQEFDRRARRLGLTRAQWLFISSLKRLPGCTQSELAESMQVQKITVSRQAKRLERDGWIVRDSRDDDARAYRLLPTPKTVQMEARITAAAAELREEYLRGLPMERCLAVKDDLEFIKTNLLALESRARAARKKKNMKSTLFTTQSGGATVALFLAIASMFFTGCGQKAAAARAGGGPAVPVQTAVARLQDVPRNIESIGNVQTLRTVNVKSQVDGVIQAIHFKEGDEVKQGDLLVTLDRRPYENALRITRADLANAQAEARKATDDAQRYSNLAQKSASSAEELSGYMTRAETTKAQVQAKEAAVANAELQYGYTEIRAPISGRTGQLSLHEGALVKANDNSFPIVTINQLSPISVAYAVPERELSAIRAALGSQGARVTAMDQASGLSATEGVLGFVDNSVDPTTGTIALKAEFANADHVLWPGQFVHVITQVGMDAGAIVVPSSAVLTGQDGSQVYVVKADRTVELRPVKVTRTSGDNSLLSDGVRADETVVSDGQLRLVPGAKIEPKGLGGAASATSAAATEPARGKKS